jgi:hypothetical protein
VTSAAPATFETRAIARGASARPALSGPARVEADGHLAIERGEAVEHLRNSEEGVEQSFSFEHRPPGAGDLAVRVRVSGQAYAGESPSGHHFVDPATGAGLRYGHATWIDGRGATSALPVRYADGELTITVPEALIEASAYPAHRFLCRLARWAQPAGQGGPWDMGHRVRRRGDSGRLVHFDAYR